MVIAAWVAASTLGTALEPRGTSADLHHRMGGALAAAGDIVWLRVAERIPFAERVPHKEAEVNYRRLILAARLNPRNREPYRFGPLGLAVWGRPDLGLKLLSEGLRRYPGDPTLELGLFAITAATTNVAIEDLMEALKPVISTDLSEPLPRLMFLLKARAEEDAGRRSEAIATWKFVRNRAGRNLLLRARADREIERLEAETDRNPQESDTSDTIDNVHH